MKEHIYSIPLTEALRQKDGCILCTLEKDLERQAVTYFLGPSMMEPDSRQITNEKGFCHNHMKMLFDGNNRLSLALMLETHIKELQNETEMKKPAGFLAKGSAAALTGGYLHKKAASCALCDKLNSQMSAAAGNLAYLWGKDEDFRQMFNNAPPLCLRHTALAVTCSENELHGKQKDDYISRLLQMQKDALGALYKDLHAFTLSFDYRNAEKELSKSEKESVSNAINYLK